MCLTLVKLFIASGIYWINADYCWFLCGDLNRQSKRLVEGFLCRCRIPASKCGAGKSGMTSAYNENVRLKAFYADAGSPHRGAGQASQV